MSGDELFAEAVEWARPFIRNSVLKTRGQHPQKHAAALLPQDSSPDEIMFFNVSIEALIATAAQNSFSFDVINSLAAACLRCGRQMPPPLATFAADILDGTQRRPTRRGPQPGRPGSLDRIALGSLLRTVATRFSLAEYSNNDDKAITAARIVVEALAREKRNVSHDAVVKARQHLGELIS